MRSKEKIEQELEFYEGCLKRSRINTPCDREEVTGYRGKVELLRWVLEDDEQFRDKHRD